MTSSTGALPPPSPSPLAQSPESGEDNTALGEVETDPSFVDPLSSVPELTTKPATSEDDKVEALHLIADSVAQQRQIASTAVIFHPLIISALVLLFGLAYQYLWSGTRSDWAIIGTTSAGILMSVLVSVRWMTAGYIYEAERVGTWKWLNQGREDGSVVGDSDEILLTRFGDETIGAIIIRGVRDSSPDSRATSPRKTRRGNTPATGVIRAWTVKRRYRHRGVGQGLLEEAIELCVQKSWNGPEFAADHANSAAVLHPTFAGGFAKRDRQAREMLERVKEESGAGADGKKVKR